MPKISVIVPIYNAEKYLRRCLESLRNQTFKDYEVVLIDDGSKDQSLQICKEYENKDKHFKIIHKDNGGVSSARQCGIDHSCGQYTIQCDADDWVESTMLEELKNCADSNDSDMIICDYMTEYKGKTIYKTQKPSSLKANDVLSDLFCGKLHGNTWNKLIRKKCYEKYDVKFPKGISFCEDLYVCAMILKHPIKVSYLPKSFYHYDRTMNEVSLVFHYTKNTLNEDLILYKMMCDGLTGFDIFATAKSFMMGMISLRALKSGMFTTKEFHHHFIGQIENIKQAHQLGMVKKILILLGIYVSYPLAHRCFFLLKKLSGKKEKR
ncbi:MAG: glycosyltransferase [Prevotella sp.]|jgi:glycosyltransferase involved in cell wall biosynthesis|nr:glycosyltransferase [Prevotella sp.]